MKFLGRTTTIIILCLLLQACSYSVEFVLINESDTTVEVEYQADMKSYMSGEGLLPEAFVPKTMSYEKWGTGHKREDWQPVASTGYQIDLVSGKFKLKIPPRTALRLAEVSDSVFFQDGYRDFQLKNLAVRGLYGSFAFEGVQLFREFTQNGKNICSITYKN